MATDQKYLGAGILPLIKAKMDAGLATKQDTLISGTNIKTINNESLLGSGNLEVAKLYTGVGENTDGAMTQKAASDKFAEIEGKLTTADGDIDAIEQILEGTVQTNTKIAEDATSTVTLVKTTAALNALGSTTDTNLPLPVASKTQAGVINPSTYETIYDTADALEAMENGAVAVEGLSASPSQGDLSSKWKSETGKDALINGAKILDITNGKTWTYYSNTQTWYSQDNTNPTIEINAFTNSAAGTILGSDTDGKVYAESDGTGSVKGWDTVKSDIANNKSAISDLQTAAEDYVEKTGLKTVNSQSLLGTGDITVQETLVSGTNIKTVNGQSILGAGDIEIDVPQALTTAEFESAWNAA